jgi:hypothetical protein
MIQENSLFNIPFWKIQIINFEEKKKELTKLLESYPEEKIRYEGVPDHVMFDDMDTNRQTDRSGLSEQFASIMNQELEGFSRKINSEFAIYEIWSVSYNKDEYHTAHNHSSMGLSGILYLDLPKDSPVTSYIQPWQNYVIDTTDYNMVPIVEGDIVIVPSFILHFSSLNKSNSKKRIIAWDMKIL